MYQFLNEKREIRFDSSNTPTPWMNYLSNGTLHAMISQAGGGVAWYRSPQIWRINHYRFFHLPTDRSGFYTYIKDGDSVWCPTCEPCACRPERWQAAHGMGYTRFTAERDGLRAEATYLVSPLKNVMLWHLELRSDRDRNVTIYPYVELGMMEFMRELQWQCYNKHQLSVYEKDGVLIYRYGVETQPKPDETPLVYFASDASAAGFDCDRDAFIGSYRSEEAPIGLEHEHLQNSTLFGGDPCFALELPLTLRAGETKSVNIYLGTELTEDEIFQSLAACKAPDFFTVSMQKLAERMGEPEFAAECKALYDRQQALCQTLAWDGAWFRRCITDEGRFIGSKLEPQAKIWLNTQSWSVLSGLGTQEQQRQAMDSVKEYLDTELGIKKIYPAMTTDYPTKEENLTCYNKGCGENGSVFCHANTWAIIAECMLGRSENAWKYYHQLLPMVAQKTAGAERYKAEPYVYSSNIFGPESDKFGLANVSWLTGTAAWMYLAATQYLLGVRPAWDSLEIDPCLPEQLLPAKVTRVFRGCTYHITIEHSGSSVRIPHIPGRKEYFVSC